MGGGRVGARRLLLVGVAAAALFAQALVTQLAPARAATGYAATLTTGSPTIVPGQTVFARLTVTLVNQPANNVTVTFSSSGDIHFSRTTCKTSSDGWCDALMTVGGGYGSQTITGSAQPLAATEPINDSKALFEYDAATSLDVSLSAASLPKDGISASTATATPRDAQGRPVMTLQPVQIADSLGLAGPVKDNHNGTYTSALTAPAPKTPAPGTLIDTVTATVTSPPLSTSSSLTLTEIAPRLVGPLRTSGTQILDGNNQPVRLKGMDAVNWSSTDTVPKLMTPAHVGNMYQWGANSVRLMLSASLYLGDCGGSPANEVYPPGYRDALQREIELVNSYGMLAVLDLHLSNPNCSYATKSNGEYGVAGPLPPKAESDALFADLASRYGNNPLVAFELYNEPFVCGKNAITGAADGTVSSSYPNGCSDKNLANQAWVFGGKVTHTNPADDFIGAGMKSAYDVVRNNGAPNSLVFVDANGFASDNRSFDAMCATPGPGCLWIGATNVVYTFHYYDCQETDPTNRVATCDTSTPEDSNTIGTRLSNKLTPAGRGLLPWSAPVHFNEFGWPQAETKYQYRSGTDVLGRQQFTTFTPTGNGRFLNNVIKWFDDHGLGWSVFAYGQEVPGQHNQWQGPYQHVLYADTVPWTPNANGAVVQKGLRGDQLTPM